MYNKHTALDSTWTREPTLTVILQRIYVYVDLSETGLRSSQFKWACVKKITIKSRIVKILALLVLVLSCRLGSNRNPYLRFDGSECWRRGRKFSFSKGRQN